MEANVDSDSNSERSFQVKVENGQVRKMTPDEVNEFVRQSIVRATAKASPASAHLNPSLNQTPRRTRKGGGSRRQSPVPEQEGRSPDDECKEQSSQSRQRMPPSPEKQRHAAQQASPLKFIGETEEREGPPASKCGSSATSRASSFTGNSMEDPRISLTKNKESAITSGGSDASQKGMVSVNQNSSSTTSPGGSNQMLKTPASGVSARDEEKCSSPPKPDSQKLTMSPRRSESAKKKIAKAKRTIAAGVRGATAAPRSGMDTSPIKRRDPGRKKIVKSKKTDASLTSGPHQKKSLLTLTMKSKSGESESDKERTASPEAAGEQQMAIANSPGIKSGAIDTGSNKLKPHKKVPKDLVVKTKSGESQSTEDGSSIPCGDPGRKKVVKSKKSDASQTSAPNQKKSLLTLTMKSKSGESVSDKEKTASPESAGMQQMAIANSPCMKNDAVDTRSNKLKPDKEVPKDLVVKTESGESQSTEDGSSIPGSAQQTAAVNNSSMKISALQSDTDVQKDSISNQQTSAISAMVKSESEETESDKVGSSGPGAKQKNDGTENVDKLAESTPNKEKSDEKTIRQDAALEESDRRIRSQKSAGSEEAKDKVIGKQKMSKTEIDKLVKHSIHRARQARQICEPADAKKDDENEEVSRFDESVALSVPQPNGKVNKRFSWSDTENSSFDEDSVGEPPRLKTPRSGSSKKISTKTHLKPANPKDQANEGQEQPTADENRTTNPNEEGRVCGETTDTTQTNGTAAVPKTDCPESSSVSPPFEGKALTREDIVELVLSSMDSAQKTAREEIRTLLHSRMLSSKDTEGSGMPNQQEVATFAREAMHRARETAQDQIRMHVRQSFRTAGDNTQEEIRQIVREAMQKARTTAREEMSKLVRDILRQGLQNNNKAAQKQENISKVVEPTLPISSGSKATSPDPTDPQSQDSPCSLSPKSPKLKDPLSPQSEHSCPSLTRSPKSPGIGFRGALLSRSASQESHGSGQISVPSNTDINVPSPDASHRSSVSALAQSQNEDLKVSSPPQFFSTKRAAIRPRTKPKARSRSPEKQLSFYQIESFPFADQAQLKRGFPSFPPHDSDVTTATTPFGEGARLGNGFLETKNLPTDSQQCPKNKTQRDALPENWGDLSPRQAAVVMESLLQEHQQHNEQIEAGFHNKSSHTRDSQWSMSTYSQSLETYEMPLPQLDETHKTEAVVSALSPDSSYSRSYDPSEYTYSTLEERPENRLVGPKETVVTEEFLEMIASKKGSKITAKELTELMKQQNVRTQSPPTSPRSRRSGRNRRRFPRRSSDSSSEVERPTAPRFSCMGFMDFFDDMDGFLDEEEALLSRSYSVATSFATDDDESGIPPDQVTFSFSPTETRESYSVDEEETNQKGWWS